MSERGDEHESEDGDKGARPNQDGDASITDDADASPDDGDADEGDAAGGDADEGDAADGDADEGDAADGDADEGDAADGDADEGDADADGDADEGDADGDAYGDADDGDADDGDADDDDAADDGDEPSDDGSKEPSASKSTASDDDPPSKLSKLWWLLPVAVIVEFWVYGHNGYIDVCVGKEGETDFALIGTERTDDNRWKFPRCETRLNLGLRGEYEAKVADATKVACRGATLFKNRGQSAQCEAAKDGWTHKVDARFCPPWDPNYYEHLFWFLK